jgi:putative CocE/NonD family hydrolase
VRLTRSPCARWWLWLLALSRAFAAEQNLDLHLPLTVADPGAAAAMRDLAERALPVYQDADHERYLTNLSALQIIAGDFASAYATRQELRQARASADPARPVERSVIYDIYAQARSIQMKDKVPFSQAFTRAFQVAVPRLNDRNAYAVMSRMEVPPAAREQMAQQAFDQWRGKSSIDLTDAVTLIWQYLAFDAYRSFGPLVGTLAAEDDTRRYIIDDDVLIKTPEGQSISAVVVRPRIATKPLATLLEFTIYVYPVNDAKECAAHGYVGVVAFSRGKRSSPGRAVPFEHDGSDARGVIGWIARQPWSDGRVGMFGSDYGSFAAWATSKRLPAALQAIAAAAPMAPGIDMPASGSIYDNAAYRWIRYVTDNKGLDSELYDDESQWRSLNENWYRSGKSYWSLAHALGKPDDTFGLWLGHPSYDSYWQKFIPYREGFAHIDIPVFTTTGYYDSDQAGALYYLSEHLHYDARADHTLLIGPYDHLTAQRVPADALHGYYLDAAALVDLRELRYQWFDYILKGQPRPALLRDRVNFEVMGANEWQHASSLATMANGSMKLYLDAGGDGHHLAAKAGAPASFAAQTVDFADRSDADWLPPAELVSRALPAHYSLSYVSDAFTQPLQINGTFGGQLDFTPNKLDMDVTIALYEQLPSGEYLQLFAPACEFRASYARDRAHRQLLKAGQRQQLAFNCERLAGLKMQAGSRLVLLLGVNKRADQQLNYGSGIDVNAESIEEAKVPLRVRWYGSSYIELPVRR